MSDELRPIPPVRSTITVPKASRGWRWLSVGMFLVVAAGAGWITFEWMINRIEIPVGKSLLLQYKGIFPWEKRAVPGRMAQRDASGNPEIGILEEMCGPGRHFYCPFWWTRTVVEDTLVKPGQVMVVTSRVGEGSSAEGAASDVVNNRFLVEGELGETNQKGILRKVFGPGSYRINPYAYTVKILTGSDQDSQKKVSGWVDIPTGYVGVVTNQTDNPATGAQQGIQQRVLPPGYYPMNPFEQKVDVVEIGFREKSIITPSAHDSTGNLELDANGEPMLAGEGGISFPSRDGFTINMDFTAVWGIMPEQAADVIRTNGNLEAVENRVVIPLIESICRNEGSKLGAVDLLVGDSRLKFQTDTAKEFAQRLRESGVELSYALIRYIYIPKEVRVPIQQAFIADELTLTRDQEQLTAKTEGMLREAERTVDLEVERIKVETLKKIAQLKAEGQKSAAETDGETGKLVASIARETAELESQAKVLLGAAESQSQQMLAEAKADKFKLAVEAFGSGEAYNQWVFADGLPEDMQLHLMYAGEGTFWTDLKSFQEMMLGRMSQQNPAKTKSAADKSAGASGNQPVGSSR